METKQQNENPTDTKAIEQLTEFVKANRQHLPALPKRTEILRQFAPLPQDGAARETKLLERAELRRRGEMYERFAELVRDAGARYRDCTTENFHITHPQQKAVLSNVLAYIAADCSENLILYGPIGTGKDHLAFSVCRYAIKSGKRVRWVNGQKWFGTVRDSFDTDKSEASLISELSRPELLCLSDPLPPVGALTQFQATMLYRLVDARYSRGVPTICTVNVHDDQDADARMGEATWDRLCHGAYKLRCQWPTYRKPLRDA